MPALPFDETTEMTRTLRERLYQMGTLQDQYTPSDYSPLRNIPLRELLSLPLPTPMQLAEVKLECEMCQNSYSSVVHLARGDFVAPWVGSLVHPRERVPPMAGDPPGYELGAMQDFVWACTLAEALKTSGAACLLDRELLDLPITALQPNPLRIETGVLTTPDDRLLLRAGAHLDVPLASWPVQPNPIQLFRVRSPGQIDLLECLAMRLQQERVRLGEHAESGVEFNLRWGGWQEYDSRGVMCTMGYVSRAGEYRAANTPLFGSNLLDGSGILALTEDRVFASLMAENLPSLPVKTGRGDLLSRLAVTVGQNYKGELRLQLSLKQEVLCSINTLVADLLEKAQDQHAAPQAPHATQRLYL